MRIILAPVGSDSEVFPMLALAQALRSKGHIVSFCAPESYRPRCMNMEFMMISSGKSFEQFLEGESEEQDFVKVLSAEIPLQFVAIRDSLREADVLVGSPLQLAGPSISKQLGLPYFCVIHSPFFLDLNEYPGWGVPLSSSGWTWMWRKRRRKKKWIEFIGNVLNQEREYGGLPSVDDLYQYIFHSGHLLVAVNSEVASLPSGANQTATGFWSLDLPGMPDPELDHFLSSGSPPVLIGSLQKKSQDSLILLREICAELVTKGHRVLVGPGVDAPQQKDLPEGCRWIESPHDSAMFARLGAVVHSGASHIVSEAARAGLPQVIVPRMADQFYWARRVHALGAAPPPVTGLTELYAAIQRAVSDSNYRECARALASKLQSQDGIANAAETIEMLSRQIGKSA